MANYIPHPDDFVGGHLRGHCVKDILFVDDHEMMTELYSRLLTDYNNRWTVATATNGDDALKIMAQKSFDVIISDMNMPGMSGLELVAEVSRHYPQTSRIIISGMSDQAIAADTLKCTHLFLSKPFEIRILWDSLERIEALDGLLQNPDLRRLASQIPALPSFPAVYLEIMKEIEAPKVTIQSIAQIVVKDPGITAKILQVANSAALGSSGNITEVAEAVQLLGMTAVRSLALSAQVMANFERVQLPGFTLDSLWNHLMQTAELARQIMRLERAPLHEMEDAFTAAMLHDMGKLILAQNFPKEFKQAMLLATEQKIPLEQAEQTIFGATHAGLAAYLFGLWGLPAVISEAVAFHHQPGASQLKRFSPLTAVHVADALLEEDERSQVNLEYLQSIGKAQSLGDWQELGADLMMARAEQNQSPDTN
ncbi:MAG TPA: response regulator [Verrucomicrobiae bacterium]